MEKYQPIIHESQRGEQEVVSRVQPTVVRPAAMEVVVNPAVQVQVEHVSAPDDSIWYWLACICCNCCGFGMMALTLHCVAQSLYESGRAQYGSAQAVWRKARNVRLAGVILGVIIPLIWLALYLMGAMKAMSGSLND